MIQVKVGMHPAPAPEPEQPKKEEAPKADQKPAPKK